MSLFSQPSGLSASISYVESVGPSIESWYLFPGKVIGLDNAPLAGPLLVITAEMLDKSSHVDGVAPVSSWKAAMIA